MLWPTTLQEEEELGARAERALSLPFKCSITEPHVHYAKPRLRYVRMVALERSFGFGFVVAN